MATGNSTLQLTSDPTFRGRVMALWAVTFSGSTPIGAPIVGAVSEFASPRAGLALGALACVLAAALGAAAVTRTPPERAPPPPFGPDGLDRLPAARGAVTRQADLTYVLRSASPVPRCLAASCTGSTGADPNPLSDRLGDRAGVSETRFVDNDDVHSELLGRSCGSLSA